MATERTLGHPAGWASFGGSQHREGKAGPDSSTALGPAHLLTPSGEPWEQAGACAGKHWIMLRPEMLE